MSEPQPLPPDLTIDADETDQVGTQAQEVLRILTFIAEARRRDWVLPAAQALAHRIEKAKLDRAYQIAQLLGEMAAQAPATKRRVRSLKADDAPQSANF